MGCNKQEPDFFQKKIFRTNNPVSSINTLQEFKTVKTERKRYQGEGGKKGERGGWEREKMENNRLKRPFFKGISITL